MERLAVTAAPAGAGVPRRPRCAHGRRRGVGVALMAGIALCGFGLLQLLGRVPDRRAEQLRDQVPDAEPDSGTPVTSSS
jgi:hypothetical protein